MHHTLHRKLLACFVLARLTSEHLLCALRPLVLHHSGEVAVRSPATYTGLDVDLELNATQHACLKCKSPKVERSAGLVGERHGPARALSVALPLGEAKRDHEVRGTDRVQCVDLTLSPPERTSRARVRRAVALAQLAASKHTVVALGKETALDGDGRPIRYSVLSPTVRCFFIPRWVSFLPDSNRG